MQEKSSPSTTTMMIPSKATIAALGTIGVSSGVSEETTTIPIILIGKKSHLPLRLRSLPITPNHHQHQQHCLWSARKQPFPGFNLPRPRRHGRRRLDPNCPTFNIDRCGGLIWNPHRPTLNPMSTSNRQPPKCYANGNRNNDSNFWKRVGGVPAARMVAAGSAETVVGILRVKVIRVDDGCDVVCAVLLHIPWILPCHIRTKYRQHHPITITVTPEHEEGNVSLWQPTCPPLLPPLSFSCWWR